MRAQGRSVQAVQIPPPPKVEHGVAGQCRCGCAVLTGAQYVFGVPGEEVSTCLGPCAGSRRSGWVLTATNDLRHCHGHPRRQTGHHRPSSGARQHQSTATSRLGGMLMLMIATGGSRSKRVRSGRWILGGGRRDYMRKPGHPPAGLRRQRSLARSRAFPLSRGKRAPAGVHLGCRGHRRQRRTNSAYPRRA